MTPEQEKTLLAALDSSQAVHGVLTVALGIAQLLGTDVEALHVAEPGRTADIAERETSGAGVRLQLTQGPVAEKISEAIRAPHVFGAVMGTRTFIDGPRPAGSTALGVLRVTTKPVAFVPPEAPLASVFAPRRLLVPLDGSEDASSAYLEMESHFGPDAKVEVAVLYVLQNKCIPGMVDRPEYDLPLLGEKFFSTTALASTGHSSGARATPEAR